MCSAIDHLLHSLVDNKPRQSFGDAELRKLQRLGELARREIATWHQQRQLAKDQALKSQLLAFHREAEPSRKALKANPSYDAPVEDLPDSIPLPNGSQSPASSSAPSSPKTHTAKSLANTFRLATRMIAETLELPLVYLISVNSSQRVEDRRLQLVSSFGLPTPPPDFDYTLHHKALRAPEGGLLYQNPRTSELKDGEKLPSSGDAIYASAILVSVAEQSNVGYVLVRSLQFPSVCYKD